MECPYCGSKKLKDVIPKRDRIHNVTVKGEATKMGSAEISVDLWKNPYPRSHMFCGSCEKSYNFTDITPETILKNLKTYDEEKAKRIATQINHYYSGTDVILTTLILDYCTGIVRPFRTKIPYITNKLLKQKLHVCFNYNHQRTYLAITKITFGSKKDKLNYYDYDSLVMSI